MSDEDAARAIAKTVVIKLNGGLGTSMGWTGPSRLCAPGLSFLDIIARQVLHLRKQYDVTLPLIFMNSFRTSADTMAALARYGDLPVEGLPLEFLQNKVPEAAGQGPAAGQLAQDPDLEWCPPGHGDLYTALRGTGLLDRLLEVGYERVFVSNSDNLGAVPDARIAGWFAGSGAPFAIEAVRRTPPTARAATSRAARTTAGWCSGRPRRRCPPTRRRWPTSSGTGSARPTTCGSTSRR